MKNLLKEYIISKKLIQKGDKILVAISGGMDSVVLTELLYLLKYNISLAHCNFHLRGEESNKDEAFVKKLATKLNLKLHIKHFDTETFAKENSYSIEEAARLLRYNWFEEIRHKNSLDYIATAHHLDDKIETFFINITAGTGIRGIRSIKEKNNNIIRPLLFAKRRDIENYVNKNNIEYRTDKSNFETKFIRNKFRHEILPKFSDINPSFQETMSKNFDIFSNIEKIYDNYIDNSSKKVVSYKNGLVYINLKKLLKEIVPETLLFEIIKKYGFNYSQTSDILQFEDNIQSGKQFFSKKYRLLINREDLIISKISEVNNDIFYIEENQNRIDKPITLKLGIIKNNKNFKLIKDKKIAYFDADKIKFPLKIRTRKNGDFFHPFGMNGKKLISDYFTDIKLSTFEKESSYLLLSENNIIWVIGLRTDNKFKITNETKNVLVIQMQ